MENIRNNIDENLMCYSLTSKFLEKSRKCQPELQPLKLLLAFHLYNARTFA